MEHLPAALEGNSAKFRALKAKFRAAVVNWSWKSACQKAALEAKLWAGVPNWRRKAALAAKLRANSATFFAGPGRCIAMKRVRWRTPLVSHK
jgi:hypothetical protein